MCPIGEYFNTNTEECESCRDDQEWNSSINKCECPEDMEEKDNACQCKNIEKSFHTLRLLRVKTAEKSPSR